MEFGQHFLPVDLPRQTSCLVDLAAGAIAPVDRFADRVEAPLKLQLPLRAAEFAGLRLAALRLLRTRLSHVAATQSECDNHRHPSHESQGGEHERVSLGNSHDVTSVGS